MLRNSFRGRLILGALVWISAGIGISGFILSSLFRDMAIVQFDHDLSDHIEELKNVLDIDSQRVLFVHRALSDPRFSPALSGVYWQVTLSNGMTVRSPSLDGHNLPLTGRSDSDPHPKSVVGPTGPMRLLQKEAELPHLQETVQIGVGIDARLIDETLAHFNKTLALSLGIVAIGLIGAAFAQVSYGLLPLARIHRGLTAVRTGAAASLPDDLPEEVAPLASDLNAMIVANQDMIRRARAQAGNLAHALKTPLAILMEEGRELEKSGQVATGQLVIEQCTRMQRQIDYQTARARAAARITPGVVTKIAPLIQNVIGALSHLHRDRSLNFELHGHSDLLAACDSEDLNEMIANLIDNAAKWARSQVAVSIERVGTFVRITVEDDGPGVPPESTETVFEIGERLDERKPGTGLGLPITRDLATLYGGRTWIERSKLGGAAASIELPTVGGH